MHACTRACALETMKTLFVHILQYISLKKNHIIIQKLIYLWIFRIELCYFETIVFKSRIIESFSFVNFSSSVFIFISLLSTPQTWGTIKARLWDEHYALFSLSRSYDSQLPSHFIAIHSSIQLTYVRPVTVHKCPSSTSNVCYSNSSFQSYLSS